ncbi:MAG: hypothetical protein EPN82_15805 [Bacteroidetes bacterium]|nr:MAG: hypothetical protein EPN82_15805 [Bacteroidota bacterium]
MKCQVCNSDINEVSTCPVCGAEIEPENINLKHYPWLLVYTTNTLIDAEMFKANLESADIPVHILSQIDSTRQLTIGDLAIVKIYVPSIYESDAKAIIEQIESDGSLFNNE